LINPEAIRTNINPKIELVILSVASFILSGSSPDLTISKPAVTKLIINKITANQNRKFASTLINASGERGAIGVLDPSNPGTTLQVSTQLAPGSPLAQSSGV